MAHNQHFWIVHSINVSSDTSAFPFVDAEGSSHMKKQREGISGRNWPPVELDGRIQSLQLTYILRSLWCWATHFSSVLLTVRVFRSDYNENAFDWENVEIGSCSLYCIALRNSQRVYKKTSETKHSNPAIVVMSTIHGQAAVPFVYWVWISIAWPRFIYPQDPDLQYTIDANCYARECTTPTNKTNDTLKELQLAASLRTTRRSIFLPKTRLPNWSLRLIWRSQRSRLNWMDQANWSRTYLISITNWCKNKQEEMYNRGITR